ncbi:MAG: hypothetical protein EDR02_14800 [Actinobacteria bacterium]|nr:MAG: hypothetical protein EDR02_14800 [Actinomycetota bacterium]RIK06379.1 MAG: hypothetical protein DCC48_08125 [Acidobacteriota bacterium]
MPLTRAGFANVPEVPLSGRHLILERSGRLARQELARYRAGDLAAPFCCFVVRRNDGGEPLGVALTPDLDVENESASMAVRMVRELAGSELEAEAAGLFLNYLFELHRLREVRVDVGRVGPGVARLVCDLSSGHRSASSDEASPASRAGVRLSFADWRAKRGLVEQMCGLPPRPGGEERFLTWEARTPNGSPGRSP